MARRSRRSRGKKSQITRERLIWLGIFILALVILRLLGVPISPATPFTPAEGEVVLFVQPEAGREPLLQVVQSARESIDLTIYLFSDDTMAEALIDAARRGVHVRVLMEMDPFGGGETNAAMARRLSRAGIQVKDANPVFRYTHQKSLVVDGRTGVIMTMNLTPTSFSRNREYGVIFTNPQWVAEMETVFNADWDRVAPQLPSRPYLVWSPVNARETILALIQSAQESLDLEQADLADDEVADALVAAARRGVKVRLIRPTPSSREEDEAAHVRRLLAAGGAVAFMDSPNVHAKVIVVDRRQVLIGSMNLTMTSLDFNRELGVVLSDEQVVREVLDVIERDWRNARPARAAIGNASVKGELTE